MPEFNFKEVEWPDTPFPLIGNLMLLGRRGSEAHGTFIPTTDPSGIDDRDLLGVVIPPAPFYLGIREWTHAEAIKGVWDVVLYELRKFVGLLLKQNPNVIGMLWLHPEDYLYVSPLGADLLRHRELFRARDAAYKSFMGYAQAQLKKMTEFHTAGYMGAKRKALVEKYGFDCKNAAHLIRLLHVGEEYLRTGEMRVRRTWDVEMIRQIKTGAWPLERVKEHAEACFALCKEAHEHSVLPEEIDLTQVETWLVSALKANLL